MTIQSGNAVWPGDDPANADMRMVVVENPDGSANFSWTPEGTGRRCGDCQLCCRLLGVKDPALTKPANQRCKHQRACRGCMIYDHRPRTCRVWSCRWLAFPETAGMPRPDRCHYVIDMLWDYVRAEQPDGSEAKVLALQVWADPAFPGVLYDPVLRGFIERMGRQYRAVTILRVGSRRGTILIPPAMNNGVWREEHNAIVEPEHSALRQDPWEITDVR